MFGVLVLDEDNNWRFTIANFSRVVSRHMDSIQVFNLTAQIGA